MLRRPSLLNAEIPTWFYANDALIALVNAMQDNPLNTNNAPKNCNLDEILINAATAALFKRFGDNSAILNDSDIKGKVDEIRSHYNTTLHDTSADETHALWKRYVGSGNFQRDAVANKNTSVDMNLEGSLFYTKITLTGEVVDTDSTNGVTLDADVVDTIFGTGTQITYDSGTGKATYEIDLLLTLVQTGN